MNGEKKNDGSKGRGEPQQGQVTRRGKPAVDRSTSDAEARKMELGVVSHLKDEIMRRAFPGEH